MAPHYFILQIGLIGASFNYYFNLNTMISLQQQYWIFFVFVFLMFALSMVRASQLALS
jgi:hypothetical protein